MEHEALGGTRRLEALHLALSSAERLVRDVGPVVLASSLLMVGAQADLLESSAIRAQLVGRHLGQHKAEKASVLIVAGERWPGDILRRSG